jgi:hypothetical protein
MQPEAFRRLSRWTLRLDGSFLAIAGSLALLTETIGHFFGVGPMAATLGSANILFWSSFVQQDLLMVGIVTTALHFIFVAAQAYLLTGWRGERLTPHMAG